MRALVVLLMTILWPGTVVAQPSAAAPPRPASWDVTGAVAFLTGRPDLGVTDRYYDNWYETGQVGAIIGRHLTNHLKLELEASTSAEARQYVPRPVTIPVPPFGNPQHFVVSSERNTKLHQVAALVTWQFLENEWAHPFLQIGAGADIERVRWSSYPSVVYFNDPRAPGSPLVVTAPRPSPESRTLARVLVGGGGKFYVTPRAFFRVDARVGAGDSGGHVAVRLGFGADF